MRTKQLRRRIQTLLARLPGLGIGAELNEFSNAELRGLYAFLKRLAGD